MKSRHKLVYLVQCHSSPVFLAELFSCLYSPADFFFIHVDAKSPSGLIKFAALLGNRYPNVRSLSSALVSWGGFSQAEILLRTIDQLPSLSNEDWTHFIVLSEQHLPLTTAADIANRLDVGVSYIPYNKYTDFGKNEKLDIDQRLAMRYQEVPGIGVFAKEQPEIPQSFYDNLFHSDNWYVLSREACERLFDRSEDSEVIDLFRASIQPDEMLIPTLLLGYPRKCFLKILRKNASFVAHAHLGGLPGIIFTEENFKHAIEQRYLFIRKRPTELPVSVDKYMRDTTDFRGSEYQDLIESAIAAQSEGTMPRYREDITRYFSNITNAHTEIAVEDLGKSGFSNIPALYLQFRSPTWHKSVKVALLSEDFHNFKVVLVWDDHSGNFFEPKRLGKFTSFSIRARVHGLFGAREIFLEPSIMSFLVAERPADLAAVANAVFAHFACAHEFSRVVIANEENIQFV